MMLKKKDIEVREPHDDIDGPDYSAFFFKKKTLSNLKSLTVE